MTLDLEVEAAAVADLLQLSLKTLRNWRDLQCGPPSSRTTRSNIALYPIASLARYLLSDPHAGRGVLALGAVSSNTPPVAPMRATK